MGVVRSAMGIAIGFLGSAVKAVIAEAVALKEGVVLVSAQDLGQLVKQVPTVFGGFFCLFMDFFDEVAAFVVAEGVMLIFMQLVI